MKILVASREYCLEYVVRFWQDVHDVRFIGSYASSSVQSVESEDYDVVLVHAGSFGEKVISKLLSTGRKPLVVVLSSYKVYGDWYEKYGHPILEDVGSYDRISAVGLAIKQSEERMEHRLYSSRVGYVIFRMPEVLGEFDYGSIVSKWAVKKKVYVKPVELQFVAVSDFVGVLQKLLEYTEDEELLNFVLGRRYNVGGFAMRADVLAEKYVEYTGATVIKTVDDETWGAVMSYARLRSAFGWEPIVRPEEAIMGYLRWLGVRV